MRYGARHPADPPDSRRAAGRCPGADHLRLPGRRRPASVAACAGSALGVRRRRARWPARRPGSFTGSDSGASGSQVAGAAAAGHPAPHGAEPGAAEQGRLRPAPAAAALAGKGGYRIVAASVIANGQGFQQTVTLDAGSRDGVKPRETVLNGQGLVGEVTSVGRAHLHGAAGHRLVLDRRRPARAQRPDRLGDRAGQDAQRLRARCRSRCWTPTRCSGRGSSW